MFKASMHFMNSPIICSDLKNLFLLLSCLHCSGVVIRLQGRPKLNVLDKMERKGLSESHYSYWSSKELTFAKTVE